MNRDEARQVLQGRLLPYKTWPYAKLEELIGMERVTKLAGPSGTEYYFELTVAPVNECDPTLVIEGMVTETKGRNILPRTEQAEFGLSPSGEITYESEVLKDNSQP